MEFSSQQGALFLNGLRFFLKGCSWFGCEGELKCVHGIWSRNLGEFLDFLVQHHFNAIRLPFTAELALDMDGAVPGSINYSVNKELEGKSAGQVLDYLIQEAGKRGLLIMLDMHCLTPSLGITPLWYTDEFPEEKLIQAWTTIVTRYLGAKNVFAIDLKNEPHTTATWGDGNLKTDWRLAAQRLGNAVLAVNPKLLIFVEGSSGPQTPITTPEGAFWGGSLASAREAPVKLNVPGKLVYSPHVYGPGVYMQEYFKDPRFPQNMPDIWTRQWGHLVLKPKAGPAVVVGEWGGFFKEESIERAWAEAFVYFLQQCGATDQFFWCLNPNSGDTGGLLEDDWVTPNHYKLDLLRRLCPNPSRVEIDSCVQPANICLGPDSQSQPGIQPCSQPSHPGNSVQGIVIDTEAIPCLAVTARICNQWVDGQRGHEYQVEGSFRNLGAATISDVRMEICPANCVQQLWNLQGVEPGKLYGLPGYCVDRGLQPQEELRWGGIFSQARLKLSIRPAMAIA